MQPTGIPAYSAAAAADAELTVRASRSAQRPGCFIVTDATREAEVVATFSLILDVLSDSRRPQSSDNELQRRNVESCWRRQDERT